MAGFMEDTSSVSKEQVRKPKNDYGPIASSGFQAPQNKQQMGEMGGGFTDRGKQVLGRIGQRFGSSLGMTGGGTGGGRAPLPSVLSAFPGRMDRGMGSVRSRFGGERMRDRTREAADMYGDRGSMMKELGDRTEILRRNPAAIGSRNPFARMLRGGRDAAVSDDMDIGGGRGSLDSEVPAPGPAPVPHPYDGGAQFEPPSIYNAPSTGFFGGGGGAGGRSIPGLDRAMERVPMLPRRAGVYNPYGAGGAFEGRPPIY